MPRAITRRPPSYVLALTILCAVALAIMWRPASAHAFTRAFTDDVWSEGGTPWIVRTQSTGARIALIDLTWAFVEPNAPAGGDPTSPSDPQYNFGYVDALVRRFAGTGISVAFLVSEAPRWAEAPGGPAAFEGDGSWKPNATAYGQFAAALARRYSGSYPDPLHPGQTLPRVRYFQAWAEANFDVHLAPQWTRSHGAWVPFAPSMYRNMLNSFYNGIKQAHSDNVVLTTGFGPYGDSAGGCSNPTVGVGPGCRMPPVQFASEMMCLHGHALSAEPCPQPAHFNAVAVDPYEVGSPTTHAATADDVSSPDLSRITRIVRRASATGRAVPGGHKQLWVTEFSYQSRPPNPTGVSLSTQARWLEQSLYLFWKQGVSVAVWYLVRDQSAHFVGGLWDSGVYFYSGKAKPSFEAYRFPLVVAHSGHAANVWGIFPRPGRLAVQRKHGRAWKTLFHVSGSTGKVFVHRISASAHGNYRAVVHGEASLVWHY